VKAIISLAEKYIHNRQEIESKDSVVNESEIRLQYIDPFLEALGWDVRNKAAAPARLQEVIIERRLESDKPDYQLQVNGESILTIEAKRASIDIKTSRESLLQSRRYGFTLGHSTSMLFNFRSLVILDSSFPPSQTDDPRRFIIKSIDVEDLASTDTLDWITQHLSRDSILSNKSAVTEIIQETITVDGRFVEDLARWRLMIANHIFKSSYENIPISQIDFDSRHFIDQLVFLRVAEAKSGQLLIKNLNASDATFENLAALLQTAKAIFNSDLFNISPNSVINIPVQHRSTLMYVVKIIIGEMYAPSCPYEFTLIPQDVLSQAYERFLGSELATNLDNTCLEESKDGTRRKKLGIFYTPNFVAKHIAYTTLTKAIDGREFRIIRPKTNPIIQFARPFKILDPACGSGTFLSEAYQFMLDWYLDHYLNNDIIKEFLKFSPAQRDRKLQLPIEKNPDGSYDLTTSERRRILESHIFGFDIDNEACETTRLTLGIILTSSLQTLQFSSHSRAILPDLSQNIICGNTLIVESEFSEDIEKFDNELILNLNPLPTHVTSFKYDVIIGNPPYRREKDYKALHDEARLTRWGLKHYVMRMDLWYYFVHRAIELLSEKGYISFIVNSYFIGSNSSKKLIEDLNSNGVIDEIFDLTSLKVFKDVSGNHLIFSFQKISEIESDSISTYRKITSDLLGTPARSLFLYQDQVPKTSVLSNQLLTEHNIHLPLLSNISESYVESVYTNQLSPSIPNFNSVALSDVCLVRQGIAENPSRLSKGDVSKYCPDRVVGEGVFQLTLGEILEKNLDDLVGRLIFPYHTTAEISEYNLNPDPPYYIVYSTRETIPDINLFPNLRRHLEPYIKKLLNRREVQKNSRGWWHLHWSREDSIWKTPKVISVNMGTKPPFAYSKLPTYTPFSTNLIIPLNKLYSIEFLTAVLNSPSAFAWFQQNAKRRGAGLEINGNHLNRFPLPSPGVMDSKQHYVLRVEENVKRLVLCLNTDCQSVTATPASAIYQTINDIIANEFMSA